MDRETLVRQLSDIQQPEVSFWWPLATGWYYLMLFILLIIVLIFLTWWFRTRIRREALKSLHQIKQGFKNDGDYTRLTIDINKLLKRVAALKQKNSDVYGLTGRDWLLFLDQHSETTGFVVLFGKVLTGIPYQKHIYNSDSDVPPFSVNELINLCSSWIRRNT